MKKIFVLIISITPMSLFAVTLSTTCPSGYRNIATAALVFPGTDGACPTGTSQIRGSITSCFGSDVPTQCFMYAATEDSLDDASGTFQFSIPCPLDNTSSPFPERLGLKCVKFSSSTICSNPVPRGLYDWSGLCSGIAVAGVGLCSAADAMAPGEVLYGHLPLSGIAPDNVFCWCKVTNPVESAWVALEPFASTYHCTRDCATKCAMQTQFIDSDVRKALFSELEGSY